MKSNEGLQIMDSIESLIRSFGFGIQLKRMPRTGWVQVGVSNVESVASHSYSVSLIALSMSKLIDQPVDLGKLLSMALLHDLAESVTSDLPSTVERYLPKDAKNNMERSALKQILEHASFADEFLQIWEEMIQVQTIEAKIVKDADRIDMYLQALQYETETRNVQIEEFWNHAPEFFFPVATKIYENLVKERNNILK